jgi:hypothetical protein
VENVFADNENEASNIVETAMTSRMATRKKLAKRRLSFQKKRKYPYSTSTTTTTTSTTTTKTTTSTLNTSVDNIKDTDGNISNRRRSKRSKNFESNVDIDSHSRKNNLSTSKGGLSNLTSTKNKKVRASTRTSKKISSKNKKNERDIEYLATYTKKLTTPEKKNVEQQRTIFKLKISGAIYGSLARSSTSRSTSTNIYEVKEKRTLKFKMSQDVYLSLFQASGTARRLLSVRNKTAPIGFTAFNIYRREMKSEMSLNEIGKKWREMGEQARQVYYDKVEEEEKDNYDNNSSTTASATKNKVKTKNKNGKSKSGKAAKKTITTPFLHEVRRFQNLNELTRIFGPATLRRNVGTILTPTGRIHVAHVVASPVRFKYNGQKGELGMQFDYKVEYVRPQ